MTTSLAPLKIKFVLILILGITIFMVPYTTLNLVLPKTHEVLLKHVIVKDNTFKVQWIHSVELTPWEELFKVTDGKIYLEETRFQSFGAGVPDAIGTHSKTENGYVSYSGIHKEMPSLIYGISPIAKHQLIIGTKRPKTYDLYQLLPADTALSFEVEQSSLLTRLYKKLLLWPTSK